MPKEQNQPKSFRLTVEPDFSGTRLDKFLANKIPHISRTRLKDLITSGNVQVDGKVWLQPKSKVKPNQAVEVTLPPPTPLELQPSKMDLHILYEDGDLVAINKPAGMVVHPGAGNQENTLVHGLLHHCDNLSGIGGKIRPGIVHRLDKDTSGVIIVAKNDLAHQALTALFKERKIKKTYVAIISGQFTDAQGLIELPIGRHPVKRTKMAVDENRGRSAITKFKVKKNLFASQVLEVRLITGRTHQIRVHMAHLGHPLLGDKTYGGPSTIQLPGKAQLEIPRQMLHSAHMELIHPLRDDFVLKLSAPLPHDMRQVMERLAEIS